MIRKLFVFSILLLGVLSVEGVSVRGEEKKGATAPYVHAVIFYMKKEAPQGAIDAAIADVTQLLAGIPSVRGVRVGRPAKMATPDYAKSDYNFGLLVLFNDYAGLKEYLDHPKHLEYVKRHGNHFDKVLVYDFEDKK